MKIEQFLNDCRDLALRQQVRLDKYTTMRVGGPADFFAEPESEEALFHLIQAAKMADVPLLLMGNGSNLIVRDGGFRGLVIRLGKAFSGIHQTEKGLYACAGALMSTLSREALQCGYTGLEFAQGIPGTVGGGAYMNAGAYGGEIGKVADTLRIWDGRKAREISAADMQFGYRHTRAMEEGWLVLGVSFSLEKGDSAQIDALMQDFALRRKTKQPLEYPSSGSFFKRPKGYFAGALIEQAGLKGLTVGGAQVSPKHAGFIINAGNATASDILALMRRVQDAVWEMAGVHLENEVRIVGSDT